MVIAFSVVYNFVIFLHWNARGISSESIKDEIVKQARENVSVNLRDWLILLPSACEAEAIRMNQSYQDEYLTGCMENFIDNILYDYNFLLFLTVIEMKISFCLFVRKKSNN